MIPQRGSPASYQKRKPQLTCGALVMDARRQLRPWLRQLLTMERLIRGAGEMPLMCWERWSKKGNNAAAKPPLEEAAAATLMNTALPQGWTDSCPVIEQTGKEPLTTASSQEIPIS